MRRMPKFVRLPAPKLLYASGRDDLLAIACLTGRCIMLDRKQILAGLGAAAIASVFRRLSAAAQIKPDETSALLVIDVQNCFLPGGSLAVKEGDQIVP